MLNGIAGYAGLGKSTVTLDLAARVSSGHMMPDGERINDPEPVLIVSAEDHRAAVIVPRLRVAGADMELVHIMNLDTSPFHLAMTGEIEATILQLGISLVFIDPVTAFIAGTDSYKDAEWRQLLAPLTQVAERTRAAIVLVTHLKKGHERTALHKIAGSIGIGAALRVISLVDRMPEGGPDDRVFVPLKSNLSKLPTGWEFRLVNANDGSGVARVEWGYSTLLTADALFLDNKPPAGPGGDNWEGYETMVPAAVPRVKEPASQLDLGEETSRED